MLLDSIRGASAFTGLSSLDPRRESTLHLEQAGALGLYSFSILRHDNRVSWSKLCLIAQHFPIPDSRLSGVPGLHSVWPERRSRWKKGAMLGVLSGLAPALRPRHRCRRERSGRDAGAVGPRSADTARSADEMNLEGATVSLGDRCPGLFHVLD